MKLGLLRVLQCLGLAGVVAVKVGHDVTGTVVAVQRLAVSFVSFRSITRLSHSLHQLIFCPPNAILAVISFPELPLVLSCCCSNFHGNLIYLFMIFVVDNWIRIFISISSPTFKDFSNSWLDDTFDTVLDVLVGFGRPTIHGLGLSHFCMCFDECSGSDSFKILLFLLEFSIFVVFLFFEVILLLLVVKSWHFLLII